MKFICEKEKLLLGLNYVTRTSVGRTTDAILEGVLLNLKNNSLTLTTNDLDIGMEYVITDCYIAEEGKTVVDCKMFGEIIRKLPNSEITIHVNDNKLLVIECEGSVYKLSTMNPDEFTTLPTINVEKSIALSQKMFKEMVKKTMFAVSSDENRPIFTGCLFEMREGKLFIVAVDGFRLALRKTPTVDASEDFTAIIPGKYLNEVVKNVSEDDSEIVIGVSKNQALFEFNDCKIVTRILEGEFLNYNNVIPNNRETRIKVKKDSLQGAIERASIFSITAGEKEKKYPIKMYVSLGSLIVSCTSQVGDAKEEVIIETEGKELEIGFNPKYLLDALKNIEDDEVYLDFGSNISPCIIRPVVEDKFIYMVSPIRLKE
ncbi:MAG: DNA polymerase III subunit beta [Clostridia bacterium]|nr:DNA polymerase III subunit beta [Clostridia bacterium]